MMNDCPSYQGTVDHCTKKWTNCTHRSEANYTVRRQKLAKQSVLSYFACLIFRLFVINGQDVIALGKPQKNESYFFSGPATIIDCNSEIGLHD